MVTPPPKEAAELGRQRSIEVRQAAAMERYRRTEVVDRVVSETEDLAPAALSAALAFVARLEEALPGLDIDDMLSAQRAANTAEIIHRISRLASGQSTANVAHAQLTDEERKERMAHLRSIAEANQAQRDADTSTE
jgi:hypothetical protein